MFSQIKYILLPVTIENSYKKNLCFTLREVVQTLDSRGTKF